MSLMADMTHELSSNASEGDSHVSLLCDRPGCKTTKPFLNRSELRRHQTKHTRPYPCKVAFCTAKPFGDKAGLIRHGREVHGVQAEGGPAPEFRCSVAGCKRGLKGFSRHYHLDQHYRRIHGRSIDEGEAQSSLLRGGEEGTKNHLSKMDIDGSTECTPLALEIGRATLGQVHDQISIPSSQRLPDWRSAAPLEALQAQLDSLKAQKLETVRRLDGDILTLEAALAVMRRGS